MPKQITYYQLDENGNSQSSPSNNEAYIDDGDLKELLLEFLNEDISSDEIEEILKAASDENLTEEEFDKLVDEFILKNKK